MPKWVYSSCQNCFQLLTYFNIPYYFYSTRFIYYTTICINTKRSKYINWHKSVHEGNVITVGLLVTTRSPRHTGTTNPRKVSRATEVRFPQLLNIFLVITDCTLRWGWVLRSSARGTCLEKVFCLSTIAYIYIHAPRHNRCHCWTLSCSNSIFTRILSLYGIIFKIIFAVSCSSLCYITIYAN